MLDFEESGLREALEDLRAVYRFAFAAACAQRLWPCFETFCRWKCRADDRLVVEHSLDALWESLTTTAPDRLRLNAMAEQLHELIPNEDDAAEAHSPYAEDAAAAIFYAIRARLDDDIQPIIWSARRVYEALDNFVIRSGFVKAGLPSKSIGLAHPLIQRELQRQQEDLRLLKDAVINAPNAMTLLHAFRQRAIEQSETVFAAIPG